MNNSLFLLFLMLCKPSLGWLNAYLSHTALSNASTSPVISLAV